jgi:hypothetical protein
VLFLMLLENLTSAPKRGAPLFQEPPCALELFAPNFLHSSLDGAIGRSCNCVQLGQPDL